MENKNEGRIDEVWGHKLHDSQTKSNTEEMKGCN